MTPGFSPPDHYMQVLSCKQGCITELALQPGREKPLEDFLPSHFNYLQFAYYNSKQLGALSAAGHRCGTRCSAATILHGQGSCTHRVGWDRQGPSKIV